MKYSIFVVFLFMSVTLFGQNKFYADEVKYIEGEKVLFCSGNNMKVCITFHEEFCKNKEFRILVSNESQEDVNFDPTQIKATYIKKGKKKECDVYSFDEYLKKEKRHILLWGPDNVENVKVKGKTETKDADGQIVSSTSADISTEVYSGARDAAYKEAEERLNSTYLKKNTILPNENIIGIVVTKNPKVDNLILTIPINKNLYIFDLATE